MMNVSKGMRLHIGLFGKRNAGKSACMNVLAGQACAIVSDFAGTTTDPVEKAMELPPLGPVVLIDTAGFDDDAGEIGRLRVEKSMQTLDRCDAVLLVVSGATLDESEVDFCNRMAERKIPTGVIFTFADRNIQRDTAILDAMKIPFICIRAAADDYSTPAVAKVRAAIISLLIGIVPEKALMIPSMMGDLIQPSQPVLLITPIDKEAPKGRMILPQVQAIRDVLDNNAYSIVTTTENIPDVLANLKQPPCLAVTDSQVFGRVSELLPPEIPLTSFSILLARMKGDLRTCAEGAFAISKLKDGDRILIAESCSHHPIEDDIGRVKIPNWIKRYTGKQLIFEVASGVDFPDEAELKKYALVIHCGACTFNRRGVLSRIHKCRQAGVPFTNYGVAIAYLHNILDRALKPFHFSHES